MRLVNGDQPTQYWQYKEVYYLYYHEDENLFIDADGHVVYDIFSMITPSDIYLFKHDPSYTQFPLIGCPEVICEIITIPDDTCGCWERMSIVELLGEDYERIERFNKGAYGRFWG